MAALETWVLTPEVHRQLTAICNSSPKDLMPSSVPCGYCIHMVHRHRCGQNNGNIHTSFLKENRIEKFQNLQIGPSIWSSHGGQENTERCGPEGVLKGEERESSGGEA